MLDIVNTALTLGQRDQMFCSNEPGTSIPVAPWLHRFLKHHPFLPVRLFNKLMTVAPTPLSLFIPLFWFRAPLPRMGPNPYELNWTELKKRQILHDSKQTHMLKYLLFIQTKELRMFQCWAYICRWMDGIERGPQVKPLVATTLTRNEAGQTHQKKSWSKWVRTKMTSVVATITIMQDYLSPLS